MEMHSTENAIDYLTRATDGGRGLSKDVIEFYRVGVRNEKFRQGDGTYKYDECISFPIYAQRINPKKKSKVTNQLYADGQVADADTIINNDEYECVKLKYRAINDKSKQRFYPAGVSGTGLFGLNTVPSDATAIIITEGEFDAMAAYQGTGIPAVSLPNGVHSLPPQILPWLEKYEIIYLWLDNDEAGQSSRDKFAEKLGKVRTLIVQTPLSQKATFKDANDALLAGADLIKYIEKAKSISEENIVRIADMRDQIIARLYDFDEQKGIQSGYFKWYNNIIKGFRKGELTIFTGPTGSGKTTFLSQLSLDFLERNVPTLWGSFEVKNEILASTMMQQFCKRNTANMEREDIDYVLEDMGDLPLYFMKFFGSTDLEILFSTLEYAVYTYDISHIVIDNLQFMISGQGRGANKFDVQDNVISGLRRFATEKNVHITMVIHPKKVDDDEELTIASVFGSAKATQESDNILIIQNKHRFRYIDIRKNRFDGSIGRVPIGFDKDTKRYFELFKKEEESFYRENITMKDIIQNRISEFGTVEPYLEECMENKLREYQPKGIFLNSKYNGVDPNYEHQPKGIHFEFYV
jgi:twinkle protein